jgi:hypothetical protein
MSVPELKQKKIARDQIQAKAAKADAEECAKEATALEKTIFAKAQNYEAEYAAVSINTTRTRAHTQCTHARAVYILRAHAARCHCCCC